MTTSARVQTPVSAVLVHGGFLGPWSWADVAATLTVTASRPRCPSCQQWATLMTRPFGDFSASAADVRKVLDPLNNPCWCVVTPTAVRSSLKRPQARTRAIQRFSEFVPAPDQPR